MITSRVHVATSATTGTFITLLQIFLISVRLLRVMCTVRFRR